MQEIRTAVIVSPRVSSSSQPIERVAELFDRHQARLYRLAQRLAANPDDARDLVQETFLRVARRPGRIPHDDVPAEGWLIRILVNLCRDRRRRLATRARARISLDGAAASIGPHPEAAVVARETVRKALARLTPKRRAVVVLHELEELPVDQVARHLGMSRVTVRWHLSLGRRELASLLVENRRTSARR